MNHVSDDVIGLKVAILVAAMSFHLIILAL